MLHRDSIGGTFLNATVLCLVCSVVVSGTAVGLRSIRLDNEQRSFQREVLRVAGLFGEDNTLADTPELFKKVTPILIDLEKAEAIESEGVDINRFDVRVMSKDPNTSIEIPAELDLAGIRRREKQSVLYLVKDENGELDQYVFTINGKGLWSTMWGLLSLDRDGKTVRGLTFYQDGETPGLGGEINNPKWKANWSRKECPKVLFSENGKVDITMYKAGPVACDMPNSQHLFEGLAGSTITARGVEYTLRYWLGDHAYGPILEKIRAGEFEIPESSASPSTASSDSN